MKLFVIYVITLTFLISTAYAGLAVPLEFARSYDGEVLGNGHCATSVQHVFHDYSKHGSWPLGMTKTWKRGVKVYGNNNIPPGTAIASFNANTLRYDCNIGCHTAIYISQDSSGIQVYDAWQGQPWHQRTLRSGKNSQSNGADNFYVVEPEGRIQRSNSLPSDTGHTSSPGISGPSGNNNVVPQTPQFQRSQSFNGPTNGNYRSTHENRHMPQQPAPKRRGGFLSGLFKRASSTNNVQKRPPPLKRQKGKRGLFKGLFRKEDYSEEQDHQNHSSNENKAVLNL